MLHQRLAFTLIVFGILVSLSGCDDNITITQTQENRPPKILLWGYDYETTEPISGPLNGPWVLPADPDGIDDIAAVILRFSSVTITSLIVRPDDASQVCRRPFYADMDTIDILPYLNKSIFSVTDPLYRREDGVYKSYLIYSLLTEGGLGNHGNVFGKSVKSCYFGQNYQYMNEDFGLYPPALPSPRDVFVTYTEFIISGVSIIVYDQSGDTASVSFPDIRVIFSNATEDQTSP